MTIKEWVYKKVNNDNKSLIENLLFSRGICTQEDVYEYTHPLESKLTSPDVFCDMQKAVDRISKAISNNEKIVIYGDFDADGITSTALLYKTLKYLVAEVNYFIPDREKEGHGFETKALVNLMKNLKPKLIISVDCGISNVKEISFIKSFNVDVIITDHHEAPETLPAAFAIVNPKAPNALAEELSAKQKNFFQRREELAEKNAGLDKEVFRLNSSKERLEETIENQINYMWDEYEITLTDAAAMRNEEMTDLAAMKREIESLKD